MNALLAPEPLPVALSAEKTAMLARLAEGLAPEELYWVAAWSSARAGQAQRGLRPAEAMPSSRSDAPRLTIRFGSQSGNARRVAEQPAARSGAAGLPVRLLRADAYPQRWLACETHLLIVISTQGDGEPPDDARGFVEFPSSRRPGASRDGPARVRPARSRPGTAASSRWATGQAQQDPRTEQAVPRQLGLQLVRDRRQMALAPGHRRGAGRQRDAGDGVPADCALPAVAVQPVRAILEALFPLFAHYAAERSSDEGFGDFLLRTGVLPPAARRIPTEVTA